MSFLTFLKRLAGHTLYAAIGGFIILIVIIVSIVFWEVGINHKSFSTEFGTVYDWKESFDVPTAIKIVNHRKEDSSDLTVSGTLLNETEYNWSEVRLELDVYIDDIHVNSCVLLRNRFSFDPGEKVGFMVTCSDVSGLNRPDNLRYHITLSPVGLVGSMGTIKKIMKKKRKAP